MVVCRAAHAVQAQTRVTKSSYRNDHGSIYACTATKQETEELTGKKGEREDSLGNFRAEEEEELFYMFRPDNTSDHMQQGLMTLHHIISLQQ